MFEPETTPGEWWLPQSSTHGVSGDLTLEPEGFALAIRGSLLNGQAWEQQGTSGTAFNHIEFPVILGTSIDRRHDYTLLQAYGIPQHLEFAASTENWRFNYALIGQHLPNEEDRRFTQIRVGLDHANEFVGIPSIERDTRSGRVSIAANEGVIASAELPHGQLEVQACPTWSISEYEGRVSTACRFVITPDQPLSLPDVDAQWLGPLRDLLALAALAPTRLQAVWLTARDSTAAIRLAARTIQPTGKHRDVYAAEMLFTLASLPGGVANGMQTWWKTRGDLGQVVADLNGLLHAPFFYTTERFVTAVRAAETLHARRYQKAPSAEVEHAERVARLRAAVSELSEADRGWIEGMIERSEPPYNRHRINDLLERLGELGSYLTNGDVAGFAHRVVATRNDLTHPKSKPSKQALTDVEAIHWYGQLVLWLVRAHLLLELGYDLDYVTKRLKQIWPLRQTIERANPSKPVVGS